MSTFENEVAKVTLNGLKLRIEFKSGGSRESTFTDPVVAKREFMFQVRMALN